MQIWGACMLHALPWVPVSEPIWFLELVVVERLCMCVFSYAWALARSLQVCVCTTATFLLLCEIISANLNVYVMV